MKDTSYKPAVMAENFWKGFSFSCIKARKIILPETLETIEPFAFSHAEVIERIRIPDSIRSIDCYAFSDGRYHSISFPADWRPNKRCWMRTGTKMSHRQKFPEKVSKYSVGKVPEENIGRFRRLEIVENKEVHHKNGQITEVVDKPVSVADNLLRRLYAGRILMVLV